MHQDVISVSHRKNEIVEIKTELNDRTFTENFYVLLQNGSHSDIAFLIGEAKDEIKAHKAILSARSQYFNAMFREGGMSESNMSRIVIKDHDKLTFFRMLEFIYSNEIRDIDKCSPDEVISLLMMANEYVLDDLRLLCQQTAKKLVSIENIGKFLLLSQHNNAEGLKKACEIFIRGNKKELKKNATFKQEMLDNPELGLLAFEADDDDCSDIGSKRRRNGSSKDVVPENTTSNIV